MQRETVEVMTALTEKIENLRRPRDLLMDVKELGKFCTWTTILEAGRNGVVSGEVVLVIFGDQQRPRTGLPSVGEAADELDRIKDIHYKNGQLYLVLVAWAHDESQDFVMGSWLCQ